MTIEDSQHANAGKFGTRAWTIAPHVSQATPLYMFVSVFSM